MSGARNPGRAPVCGMAVHANAPYSKMMLDDRSGLARLYVAHRAELLRFLHARTGSVTDAEDVLQELWLRLGAAPSGPISNGRAYLFRMGQNLVLDRVRERQRRSVRDQSWSDLTFGARGEAETVDPDNNAETQLLEQQEGARLAAAIADLPDGARRVLRLHKIEGLSHTEVAAHLGISRSGVEKHMAVAMAHLRRAMAD